MNPVILHIAGPLSIHWYGLMYLIGFVLIWFLLVYRAKKWQIGWNKEKIIDLIFFCAIGVVIGGRIGYMLFYDLPNFLHNPLIFLRVWDGGMSFHGGLLGVIVMMIWWARRNKYPFFMVTDFIAPMVPIGLAAGRIGNFINGELWGKVTHVPWAIIYQQAGPLPRHPSEIYEFLLEGIGLFLLLWFYSSKPKPRMAVSGLFLIGYGCARCFCEFFRMPDLQLGYLAFGWLTMGQLLSIPMIIVGIIFMKVAYSHPKYDRKM